LDKLVKDFDNLNELEEYLVIKKKEIAEIIYDGEKIKIIRPLTIEGACVYGEHTEWCTARTDENNTFMNYKKNGPLYIILPKRPDRNGKEKYQLYFMTDEYMDENDDIINLDNLMRKYPEISNVLLDEEIEKFIIPDEIIRYADKDILNKKIYIKKSDRYYNNNERYWKKFLPDWVQSLTFDNMFNNINSPLASGVLPNGLQSLKFGDNFTNGGKPLEPGVLPDRLQSLVFGDNFTNGNMPLKRGVLPAELKSLEFGIGFTHGGDALEP
jgi:hypothetical protein